MLNETRRPLPVKFSAALLLFSLCAIAGSGCGSGGVTSEPPPEQEFAYTTNELDGTISGYSVNTSTGVLTPLSGFPVHSGVNPVFAIHDSQNRFLIVADIAKAVLRVYGINAKSGVLTEIAPSPYTVSSEPRYLVIDSTGNFVYVVCAQLDGVEAFSLDSSGVLSPVPGSPFATGAGGTTFGCCAVMDGSGKFLYVADSANVYSYAIDATNGSLTLLSTVAGPRLCDTLAVDPAGTFLYAVGAGANSVWAYALNSSTGAVAPAASSPLQVQDGAYTIAIVPSGKFAYTVESGLYVVGYNLENGVFTGLGAPYPGALGTQYLTIDPSGTYLYAPQTGSDNDVTGFQISASGELTTIPGSPTPSGGWPYSLTITTP
jgi:6-phosphogluconolactonase